MGFRTDRVEAEGRCQGQSRRCWVLTQAQSQHSGGRSRSRLQVQGQPSGSIKTLWGGAGGGGGGRGEEEGGGGGREGGAQHPAVFISHRKWCKATFRDTVICCNHYSKPKNDSQQPDREKIEFLKILGPVRWLSRKDSCHQTWPRVQSWDPYGGRREWVPTTGPLTSHICHGTHACHVHIH